MDPQEKREFLGALIGGFADIGLEIPYAYDPVWGEQFPLYMDLDPTPPLDDWIACLGVPGLLALMSKATGKSSWMDIAKGAALYGVPVWVGGLLRMLLRQYYGVGEFNIDYGFPSTNLVREFNIDWRHPAVTNVIRQASWTDMPTVTERAHSGEKLPFQQDMRY